MTKDFFNQAQAEMRAEKLRQSALRYGGIIAGVVLVVLVGVGFWEWRSYAHHQRQIAESERFFLAMNALQNTQSDETSDIRPQKETLATLVDLSAHASGTTREFSALQVARYHAQNNDLAAARKIWKDLIDAPDTNPATKTLARFLILNSQINDSNPDEVRKGLEVLASSSGPFRLLAKEGLVALDLRDGATQKELEEARRLLMELAQSSDAPSGVHQRALALLQTLGGAG